MQMNDIRTVNADKVSAEGRAVLNPQFRNTLNLCIRKTRANIARLADQPKSAAWAEDGNYFKYQEGFYEIGNWTSSFFTGMALLAWRETEDEYFLKQVLRLAPCYREKVFARHADTHHDLGFLYSLYSVALYKLTGDDAQRKVGLRAAELLARRFNPRGNFLRAWGRLDEAESPIDNRALRTDNMAIIDSLMNLPLLYWAANESGEAQYRQIAMRHAGMCMKCFIRPDYSVNNVCRFDLNTGASLGEQNGSYWARGAAWAIYGFALTYAYTRREQYLTAAERVAKAFIRQLDAEIVPWNDFRESAHPGRGRDASAGAIAVCGFQELARHNAADREIVNTKLALLERLCGKSYLDFDEACCGVQKHGQAGKNGYTSWGDYYLMEALCRELKGEPTFW